jgi:GNAT superfamily N-acetyltransferase
MSIVRKAVESDLESLTELFDRYRIFYNQVSDRPTAKMFLRERMDNHQSVIFISSNEANVITGFVQLYPLFSSTRMQRLWLLNDLFVQENFRGQGYSIDLIEKVKEWCIETSACGLILETAASNNIGNKLYIRTGFTLDTQHNYYSWDAKF